MLEEKCFIGQVVVSTRTGVNIEEGEICVIKGFGPIVNGFKTVFLEGKRAYYNPKYLEPYGVTIDSEAAKVFNTFGVPEEYLYPNKYKEEDNMKMPDKFDFYNKLSKFREEFSVGDKVWYEAFGKVRKARIYGITVNPSGCGSVVASVEFNDKGHYTEDITLKDWLDGNFGHIKRKDQLEPGDKFISNSKYKFEVLSRKFDKRTEYVKYFVERCKDGYIGVLSEEAVLRVIYND